MLLPRSKTPGEHKLFVLLFDLAAAAHYNLAIEFC